MKPRAERACLALQRVAEILVVDSHRGCQQRDDSWRPRNEPCTKAHNLNFITIITRLLDLRCLCAPLSLVLIVGLSPCISLVKVDGYAHIDRYWCCCSQQAEEVFALAVIGVRCTAATPLTECD